MAPRYAAAEYGLPYGRFATLCSELFADGRLVAMGAHASTMKPFRVRRPLNYRRDRDERRELTPEDLSDAADIFEELLDGMIDEEDDFDYSDADPAGSGERHELPEVEGEFPRA